MQIPATICRRADCHLQKKKDGSGGSKGENIPRPQNTSRGSPPGASFPTFFAEKKVGPRGPSGERYKLVFAIASALIQNHFGL